MIDYSWHSLLHRVSQSPILGKSVFQLQLYVLLSLLLLMKCDRLCESHSSQFTQVVDRSDTTNNNTFYTTYPEDPFTLDSNGVIIDLRPCALDYFYSKVSSFPCSFFLVLLTMISKLYDIIIHLSLAICMVSSKSDTKIILY